MKEKLKYGFLLLAAAVLLSACDFEHYQGRELSGTISVAPREISFGNALLKRADRGCHGGRLGTFRVFRA